MKYFNDKKIMALAIILLVFTLVYFITVNKISYAFTNDYDANFYHEQVLNVIEDGAKKYAEDIKKEFTDEDVIKYVTVQELIDNNYLIPDENGNIKDPLNEKETFNARKVKIKKEGNSYTIEIEKSV